MPMPVDVLYNIPAVSPQAIGRAADLYTEPDVGDARWPGTGLQLVPMGCPNVVGRVEDPCVQLTWAAPESFQEAVTFTPFRIEETVSCSTIGAWTAGELEEWAQNEARAVYSVQLARQAMYGSYGASANSLSTLADEVTISGDLSPTSALSAVELGLGQRLMGRGLVHVTADVLTRLASAGAIRLVGDQWMTPTGNLVVADYGYYTTNGGTNYIYGSGPVYYRTTDWQVTTGLKTSHNDLVVYVNAWSIVWFEPCPVVKAATNVPTIANFGGV